MMRNRVYYFILIAGTIAIGLASRSYSEYLPEFVNLGLGDTLWALMIYWIIGFCYPQMGIKKLMVVSLSICFLVELSQLIQEDWIISIRNHKIGALVLGKGFLWSDLVAYTLGVGMGALIECCNKRKKLTFSTK